MIPEKYVSTPGGHAIFTCLADNGVSATGGMRWLVNGTALESLRLANVESTIEVSTRGRKRGRLQFTRLPVEYNTTTVRCIVVATNQNFIAAHNSTLMIQGWVCEFIRLPN